MATHGPQQRYDTVPASNDSNMLCTTAWCGARGRETQRTTETKQHTDAKRPLLKAESWVNADVPTQTPRENNFGNEQTKPTHTGKTLRHTTNYGRIAHVS